MKRLSDRALYASIVTLIGAGLYVIINMTLQSFIGHFGGPVVLGQYTATFLTIEGLAAAMLFGTPSALTKEISAFLSKGRNKEAHSLLGSGILFLVGVTAVIGGLAIAYFDVLQEIGVFDKTLQKIDFAFLIIGSLGLSISTLTTAFYHGYFKNSIATLTTLAVPITTFVLIAVNITNIWTVTILEAISLGFIAGAIVGLLLLIYNKHLPVEFSGKQLWDLLLFSLPLFGISILAFASTWLDRILVGIMRDIADVGILTSAVIVVRTIRFVPQVLTPVFITTYTQFGATSSTSKQLSKIFSLDLFFVSLFCLGSALAVYIWAPVVTHILWGRSFGDLSVIILRIELIGVIGLAYSLQTPNFLVVTGHPKFNLWLALAHVALQSLLSIVLLWVLGIVGVAIATSMTMIIMSFARYWVISSKLGIKIQTRPILLLIAVYMVCVIIYQIAEWSQVLSSLWISLWISLFSMGALLSVVFNNWSALEILIATVKRTRFRKKSINVHIASAKESL